MRAKKKITTPDSRGAGRVVQRSPRAARPSLSLVSLRTHRQQIKVLDIANTMSTLSNYQQQTTTQQRQAAAAKGNSNDKQQQQKTTARSAAAARQIAPANSSSKESSNSKNSRKTQCSGSIESKRSKASGVKKPAAEEARATNNNQHQTIRRGAEFS